MKRAAAPPPALKAPNAFAALPLWLLVGHARTWNARQFRVYAFTRAISAPDARPVAATTIARYAACDQGDARRDLATFVAAGLIRVARSVRREDGAELRGYAFAASAEEAAAWAGQAVVTVPRPRRGTRTTPPPWSPSHGLSSTQDPDLQSVDLGSDLSVRGQRGAGVEPGQTDGQGSTIERDGDPASVPAVLVAAYRDAFPGVALSERYARLRLAPLCALASAPSADEIGAYLAHAARDEQIARGRAPHLLATTPDLVDAWIAARRREADKRARAAFPSPATPPRTPAEERAERKARFAEQARRAREERDRGATPERFAIDLDAIDIPRPRALTAPPPPAPAPPARLRA